MDLLVPFAYTRTLRLKLQQQLAFKLTINQALRNYSQYPLGKVISFQELVKQVITTRNYKRKNIPSNMLYNIHTKQYWKSNPNPSFSDCVASWHKSKEALKS